MLRTKKGSVQTNLKMERYLNKITCGDCLEHLKNLPDKSIDLLYIDPPYEQSFNGGGCLAKKFNYRREQLKKLSSFNPIPFLEVLRPKLKKFNAYIWTSKNLVDIYISWAKENNFNFDILIYAKNNPIPAYNGSYLSDVEYCIFIREPKVTFNTNLGYDKYKKVMFDNLNNLGLGHPTIKHLWMVKNAIEISSNEGDIVLDCFMGSGTTAVACKELGRNFIGFEISEEYCKIAEERLKKVNNKKLNDWFD